MAGADAAEVALANGVKSGGRWRTRTSDLSDVNAAL